jgi:hypothetical protein
MRAAPSSRRAALTLGTVLLAGACGEAPADEPGGSWFAEVTADSGLDFVHASGGRGEFWMPEIMGGGVALFDAEPDGDLDAYCVNGNQGLPALGEDPAGGSRFFRQVAPARFEDATADSGLRDGRYGMGVAVGDLDNDGDVDLLVTHVGPDRLYRNGGQGRFEDASQALGLATEGWSSSAAFFDLDRDGFLDLFVCRYVAFGQAKDCFGHAGERDYCGPKVFPPEHDLLLRNQGGTRLVDASSTCGIAGTRAAGLGVECADFDEDGWIDVYVANDAYANNLWMNRRDGTLRDEGQLRGAALNMAGQPQAGMGVIAADFDRDGQLDLFLTHLREEANTLYLNQGGRGFRDATGASRLGMTSMPFTGFGTAALDLDRDGFLDILVANGGVVHGKRFPGCELPEEWAPYAEPNLVHRGGPGAAFTAADALGGAFAARVEISRGLAAGDVDGDGDPDVLLGNIEGPARLFRNDAGGGHWLSVRCVHPGWKRDALGARVELTACGTRQVRTLSSSWSYLSSSPPRAWFGLGECAGPAEVLVRWPDGRSERFELATVDTSVELRHGEGRAE